MESTSPRNTFRSLFVIAGTFSRYRWRITLLAALGIIGALLDGIGINAVIPLVSFLLGSAAPTDLISVGMSRLFGALHIPFTFRYVAIFIAILFLLRAAVLVFFAYVRGRINGAFLRQEGASLYAAALNASWPFISSQKLGHLQNVMLANVRRTTMLLDMLVQLTQSLSGFAIYFLVAVNISWQVTLGTMAVGALLLLAVRPLVRKSQEYGDETNEAEKSLAQHLIEHLGGFKVVKVMGVERAAANAGEKLFRRLEHAQSGGMFIQQLSLVFFQPVGFLLVILLVGLTYKLGTFNLAVFAAVLYLIQKIFTYLQSIQSAFHTIAEYVPYAENLRALREEFERSAPVKSGEKPFVFKDALVFKDVSLRYGEGRPAVVNASFSIPKGAVVGIIGPSGAGKTSLADLILRLYPPTAGRVELDGTSVREITDTQWRAHVGYVPQDAFLLNATIEENIRFYREQLTHKDIEAAAKAANILDFVRSLPQGFNTVVGDRGAALSGGQRQRVALARVLAGAPDILVLDEATSSLDSESERLIHEAIYGLRGKVTVVIIAHRLSTVADADRLCIFEQGKLIEEGTPSELLKKPRSYYARHVRAERS